MLQPKLITCLKDYSKEQFLKDLTAGIIVGIIALPLSIALGIASGVSPEKGIITAIIGGFFVSLLGGSRVQIAGPTGAFVVIVYGIIEKFGIQGLIISTVLGGIFLILMGLFKFGNMIKYIPYTITTGFTSGIAVIIFSSQIKDFLGLKLQENPAEFIPKWTNYFANLNTINYTALLIGLLALLIMIYWPKINKKIPGTLIAIIVTTVIVYIFKLDVNTIGTQFGEISSQIPKPNVPEINFKTINELFMPAITIALLGAIESLLSAVVADGMIGGNHRSNMELVAQGVANIFSGLFGGIPVTGAIARTAANVKNGGRTPVSGIVHSVILLLMMLVLMPLVKFIPMTTLAAVLMLVAYNMGEWDEFKYLTKHPKSDVTVFLIAFVLTVLVDLVVAIEVGMVITAFLFMDKMSKATEFNYLKADETSSEELDLIKDPELKKKIDVYDINGPFFFGAADKFIHVIRQVERPPEVLILRMEHVPFIDATGYQALKKLHEIAQNRKVKLVFSEVQDKPYRLLRDYGFVKQIGKENFCKNIDEAIKLSESYVKI